jgi:hypothetical protein
MTEQAQQLRVLGEVARYENLHDLLRARCDELEITRASLDRLARLPSGYSAKLLSPRPMKKLSDATLGFFLPALGVKLILVEDPQALAMVRQRSDKRRSVTMLGGCIHISFSRREWKKRQRNGGLRRAERLTPERRSEISRQAAMARWHGAAA